MSFASSYSRAANSAWRHHGFAISTALQGWGNDYREPLLTWFVHKVPSVTAVELAALGLGPMAAELADRIKTLRNHQRLYKSFDVQGEIVRGLPF